MLNIGRTKTPHNEVEPCRRDFKVCFMSPTMHLWIDFASLVFTLYFLATLIFLWQANHMQSSLSFYRQSFNLVT